MLVAIQYSKIEGIFAHGLKFQIKSVKDQKLQE